MNFFAPANRQGLFVSGFFHFRVKPVNKFANFI